MSYRPKIKANTTGTLTDLPLDAETVKGGTLHKTLSASDNANFSTDKAVADYIDSKGFGPGTVKKVNNASPDSNGNVTITIPQGTVKKVNNTSPDSNGNVTITIPQGTVTSVSAGTGLKISSTASVTPKVEINTGYKLPTTTEWEGVVAGNDGRIGYLELSTAGGTLTTDQYNEVAKDMCVIKGSNGIWYYKHYVTGVSGNTYFIGFRFDINAPSNGMLAIYQYAIDINNGTKAYTFKTISQTDNANKVYNVPKINSLLSIKQTLIDKSLYNIGAYDTYVDNGDGTITITRQTGYIDLSSLIWQYQSAVGCWYAENVIPNATKCVASNYTCYNYKDYSQLINGELTTNNTGWGAIDTIIIKDSRSNPPEGILQYKLATSYTEKVLKNQPLNTLNASGSAWLQNEYNKTVNLYNINNGLNDGSNNWYVYVDFKEKGNYYLKINTTIYRLIMYYSNDDGNSWNILFDANNTYERSFSITNTSYEYILYLYITSSSAINPSNYSTYKPMISKGSTPLPYQEYGGGEIAHKEDIEPVLLWENGSPRSNFVAQSISMAQDITNFKYLYIEVSLQRDGGQGNMIFKFRSKVSNHNYLTIFDNGSSATHSTRAFTITSTININVSACSNGNGYCIPLRIFGSNI